MTSAFTVLIPARLASTRLPNKPLADIGGVPMIVRVAQQAALSNASTVVVATDSAEVATACAAHQIACVMTRADHPSGSDRLAEACVQLGLADDAIVLNVQGDEPLIDPALINAVAACLSNRPDCAMSTAAHPMSDPAEWNNPNIVKVVLDARHTALYFSRSLIPFDRDHAAHSKALPLRHIGIYAYRAGFLKHFPAMAQAPIERLEALEQLRALWHGERIAVHVSQQAAGIGVDTPEDLAKVRALLSDKR
ncbi:MAG: 3-deoxy-manno-octulosonate cytidylyltransferase [Cytophagales bacterium]|nr:3-deoxy-manno-octulosonate cytidylyltransferase [Cytophagales bacterium]